MRLRKVYITILKGRIVKTLSEYILSREPGLRGYSSQNIWRMKQFYETYKDNEIVSTLLRQISWSNNVKILSSTNSIEEKEFYIRNRKRFYLCRRRI